MCSPIVVGEAKMFAVLFPTADIKSLVKNETVLQDDT